MLQDTDRDKFVSSVMSRDNDMKLDKKQWKRRKGIMRVGKQGMDVVKVCSTQSQNAPVKPITNECGLIMVTTLQCAHGASPYILLFYRN